MRVREINMSNNDILCTLTERIRSAAEGKFVRFSSNVSNKSNKSNNYRLADAQIEFGIERIKQYTRNIYARYVSYASYASYVDTSHILLLCIPIFAQWLAILYVEYGMSGHDNDVYTLARIVLTFVNILILETTDRAHTIHTHICCNFDQVHAALVTWMIVAEICAFVFRDNILAIELFAGIASSTYLAHIAYTSYLIRLSRVDRGQ